MARKKLYPKRVHIVVSDTDKAMIEEMTQDPETPTITDVIRVAVRRLHESRRRKSAREISVAS